MIKYRATSQCATPLKCAPILASLTAPQPPTVAGRAPESPALTGAEAICGAGSHLGGLRCGDQLGRAPS